MSNYTQTTSFGAKDILVTGDPLKLVKGSEIDTEYAAIEASIATKVDAGTAGIAVGGSTASMDIASLTTITPAAADTIPISDTSSGNVIRNMTVSGVNAILEHDTLSGAIANEHIDHTGVLITTATDSGLTGGGSIAATRSLSVDITGTTGHVGLDSTTDLLLLHDTSAGGLVSTTIDDLYASVDGLSLAALADPNADRLLFWDDSAGASAWLTPSGLSISGTTLSVDQATETAKGAVELATSTEMSAETSTTLVPSVKIIADYIAANYVAAAIRSWSNVSASRSSGTTYTNTSGHEIQLGVQVTRSSSSGSGSTSLYIDGTVVCTLDVADSAGASWNHNAKVLSWIIPDGVTYRVTTSSASISRWWELSV